MTHSRRNFLKTGAVFAAGVACLPDSTAMSVLQPASPFTLPTLPYAFDALEPWIDKQTMEIHYTKHHQAYVNNLNKALDSIKGVPDDIEKICRTISEYPDAVRNNGGGHYNHSLFWKLMRPGKENNQPEGRLLTAINETFGDFNKCKDQFKQASTSRFGSGWAWLIQKDNKKLEIISTPNQDNPLMDIAEKRGTPLLALDVWEHAYYLKYQNKRADYVDGWWNVVNWDEVAAKLR